MRLMQFCPWPRAAFHFALRGAPRAALACLLLALAAPLGAETRIWTDQDGRRYDAEIVGFYQGQVTFRRADGRTFSLALSDLAPPDQLIAREWSSARPEDTRPTPPPLLTLSSYGRQFVLDEPRVMRLLPLPGKGYPSPYLGVSLIRRKLPPERPASPLEFVRVYFFDAQRKPITFPLPPPGAPQMIQQGDTTAFLRPAEFEPGVPYIVLFPIRDPSVRTSSYAVVVVGNALEQAATVYPAGSWRDFEFPDKERLSMDRYADYSAQELYTDKKAAELFEIAQAARLRPRTGEATPTRDYFRLNLRVMQPFPSAALSAQWYAFDKQRRLIAGDTEAPYAGPVRQDGMRYIIIAGLGPAALGDAIPLTRDTDTHYLHLPGAAVWDNPDVDTLVLVFGTETKKVARIYSKSGATLADLPLPEKDALGGAAPEPSAQLPERTY